MYSKQYEQTPPPSPNSTYPSTNEQTPSPNYTYPSTYEQTPVAQPYYYAEPPQPILMADISENMETSPIPKWHDGLCDCLNDFEKCLFGTFCIGFQSSITQAHIENRESEASDHCMGCIMCILTCGFGCWCCQSFVEYQNRREFKRLLNYENYEKTGGQDCLISFLCLPCAVCQHAREIKYREKTGELNKLVRM